MRNIAFILLCLSFSQSAFSQIVKGTGIFYFDSIPNVVPILPYGAELSWSIKEKRLWRWDRDLAAWIRETGALDTLISDLAANVVYGDGLDGRLTGWVNDSTLTYLFASYTANSISLDDGAATSKVLNLDDWTTANNPTNVQGNIGWNSTENEPFVQDGANNYYLVRTSDGSLTSGSVLFADANGAVAEDNAGLSFAPTTNALSVDWVVIKPLGASGFLIGTSTTATTTASLIQGYQAANVFSGTEPVMAQGYRAGYSNTTGGNWTAQGYQAAYSNTTGGNFLAHGYNAGYSSTTGSRWIAQGRDAGYSNTTGNDWIAQGYRAAYSSTTGNNFIAQGFEAGYSSTTGLRWIAQGLSAGYSNMTGNDWIAQGYQAAYSSTTGEYFIAQGYQAAYSSTTGEYFIAQGYQAAYSSTTGTGWTAQGHLAGYSNTGGNNWIAQGREAAYGNTSGNQWIAQGYRAARYAGPSGTTAATDFSNSIYIGSNTRTSAASGITNENVFGYAAVGSGSNTVTLGNTSVTGHFLSGTGSASLPSGTTAQRPTAAAAKVRNNIDSTFFEGYNTGTAAWEIFASRQWVRSIFATPAQITWTLAGDSGTQPVTSGNTASFLGGWGINTVASATDVLTITADSSEVASRYWALDTFLLKTNGLVDIVYGGGYESPIFTIATAPAGKTAFMKGFTDGYGLNVSTVGLLDIKYEVDTTQVATQHDISGFGFTTIDDDYGTETVTSDWTFESLVDVTFKTGATGGTLRTGTSAADRFRVQAYDVNGGAYTTLLEADAGNEPMLQMFSDFLFFEDATDPTKRMTFAVSGVTTGTTRTLTVPDADGTIVLGTATASMLAVWSDPNTLAGTTWYVDAGNLGASNLSPLYKLDMGASTDAILTPMGTDGSRPGATAGLLRYSTTSTGHEGYSTDWYKVPESTVNRFTAYTMPIANINGRLKNSTIVSNSTGDRFAINTSIDSESRIWMSNTETVFGNSSYNFAISSYLDYSGNDQEAGEEAVGIWNWIGTAPATTNIWELYGTQDFVSAITTGDAREVFGHYTSIYVKADSSKLVYGDYFLFVDTSTVRAPRYGVYFSGLTPTDFGVWSPNAISKFGLLYDKDNEVGTAGQVLSSTGTGLDWITPTGGTTYTFSNGLTEAAGAVKLGGTLTAATSISSGSNTLTISTATASITPLAISATTGTAMTVDATSGQAIKATSTGVNAAGRFGNHTTSTNSIQGSLDIVRTTTGTAAVGLGGAIDFYIQNSAGALPNAGRVIVDLTNATAGAHASEMEFWVSSAGSLTQAGEIAATKQWTFNSYGSGTFTGTVTHWSGWTSSGAVVESTIGELFEYATSITSLETDHEVELFDPGTTTAERLPVATLYKPYTVAATADYAATSSELTSWREFIIYFSCPSGALADRTLTLLTPSSTYDGRRAMVIASDASGTYDIKVTAGTNNIRNAGALVTTITLADGNVLRLICLYNPASSAYEWTVENLY